MNKTPKVTALFTVLACIILTLSCPYNTLTTEAADIQTSYSETLSSSRSAALGWRYKEVDGVLYKRLYDYSTGTWIGDWILVTL